MSTENKIKLSGDWYGIERNDSGGFRWMGKTGTIILGNHSYDSLKIKFSSGPEIIGERNLVINIGDDFETTIPILPNQSGEFLIPVKHTPAVRLSIPTFVPSKEDNRELGICVFGIILITPDKDPDFIDVREIEVESGIDLEKIDQKILDTASSSPCVDVVSISRENTIPFKGVYYIGQYGTCGYASAAKGYLCEFYYNKIPITWEPLYFDDSKIGDDSHFNLIIKSLINKKISEYDTVIIHCTPDLWPILLSQRRDIIRNKRVIGYATWETSKLPPSWVEKMNRSVHEIWCPSTYNKKVFEDSGVTSPITVIPHVFLQENLPPRNRVKLYSHLRQEIVSDKRLTFYNISEMNARKGVEDLVKSYCETFSSYDSVRLLLKIHFKSYSIDNKLYCINKINELTSQYPNPPKIDYIVNNMSDSALAMIHLIGDCYISLCRSEGFGIPIYEAFKYGKRIIATGYGGYIDFLTENHPGLVRFKIDKVSGMESFSKMYTEDAEWALPDLNHASELMRKEYELWSQVKNTLKA